ncbi:SPOSA6832_03601, partial [Sporobolomyces salmonicolor]
MSDHDAPAASNAVAAPPKKKMVKRKPARKQAPLTPQPASPRHPQVEQGQVEKKQPEQTGQTYNVWYHKWAGGDKYDSYGIKEKSQTRVDIRKDAGYTRADGGGNNYVCLFFARGCCPYGSECSYLHRLPPPQHILPDASLDVFGREKHSGYRDDMGGVGSFNRQNRTLYIGRIKETRETAEVIEEHFSEFGEIERSESSVPVSEAVRGWRSASNCASASKRAESDSLVTAEIDSSFLLTVKILSNRGVAFVTYVSELNAQFAKEAMMHQSLENDEVLNVRWATEDPNPTAKRSEHARLVQEGERGIARALDPDFVQRVRELDELEGTVEPRRPADEGDGEGDGDEDARAGKRQRIEIEEEPRQPALPVEAPPPPPAPAGAAGILSAHAVDSLKYMAALRQQKQAQPVVVKASTPAGLGGLAAYGSDDED